MKYVWGLLGVVVLVLLWSLWPATERAKQSGVECMANIKNIYGAMAIYSEDVGGRLPPDSVWSDVLTPYAKSKDSFNCPSVPKFGYAMNSELGPVDKAKVPTPEKTVLVFDSAVIAKNASDKPVNLPSPPRHEGKNVILFVDGHSGQTP